MTDDVTITKKERDCIVAIGKRRNDPFPVRVSTIAKALKLKLPTVEEIIQRLVSKDIVKKNGGMVILTDSGNRCYEDIIMKHRVLETFLSDCGVDPDKACKEISNFDYLVDKESAEKINEKIGKPEKCPHGLKIIEAKEA